MYSALSWVPSGASRVKLPQAKPTELSKGAVVDDELTDDGPENESSEEDQDGPVDVGEVLAKDLDTLALFKSNADDPYLASDPDANDLFDAEELDDLIVRPTDSLIVAAKTGDDASMLEFHLLEDDAYASDAEKPYKPHYYIHHDLVLPTLPLCTAFTSLNVESSPLNLVAVGYFTPGIDIWDVDRVNVLEPVTSLGGYDINPVQETLAASGGAQSVMGPNSAGARKKGKSAKKKRLPPKLKDESHTDAVMSLSWNNVQKEYLASGSADTTVKVWDVESSHCASTLRHHTDKVQSVAWHPTEESTLLTGSFDRSVHVVDVRAQKLSSVAWRVKSDIEACQWGHGTLSGCVVATTEDGGVSILERQRADVPLVEWKAHDGAVSACALSRDVPGMLVTGGTDRTIKVWDVRGCENGTPPRLVFERQSKAGAVFAAAMRPLTINGQKSAESPFVVAFAGAKGLLVVADLAIESEAVRETFADAVSTTAADVLKRRVARFRRSTAGGVNRTRPAKMADDSEHDDSDSESHSSYSADSDDGEGDEAGSS